MPIYAAVQFSGWAVASRRHQEQVEREKALKEAKAKADGNAGQAKASMNAVKELLREESKRCASPVYLISKLLQIS